MATTASDDQLLHKVQRFVPLDWIQDDSLHSTLNDWTKTRLVIEPEVNLTKELELHHRSYILLREDFVRLISLVTMVGSWRNRIS